MVSKFFHRPSHGLKHHTVSLLPEVEAIIETSVSQAVERVTIPTGRPADFSISTNMLILGRLTSAVTEQRKGRNPDPDTIEWLMDLVDGKRHITDEDLHDYAHFLTFFTEAYRKRRQSEPSSSFSAEYRGGSQNTINPNRVSRATGS
jgi:hypothetical protein